MESGASYDQALMYATADSAKGLLTGQVPLDVLLDSVEGDPRKAVRAIENVLKQSGIEMTSGELNLLGIIAAEASAMQQDASFSREIALERLKDVPYEQAQTAASQTLWQEATDKVIAFGIADSISRDIGQGQLAEAIDTDEIPKYNKENGQEALDGTRQTDEWDVRNGSPYSPDKSSQSSTIIQDAIDSGQVSAKINREKQMRHTKDNHGLGKSYLYGDLDYAQELVDKYSGTGDAISAKGKWTHRERIIADNNIGIYVDSDGNETESNQAIIVYSKTGTHIYPARKENLDET